MSDVAQAVDAKCAFKFDSWHEVEGGSLGGSNASLRALLESEEEDDRKAARQETLALILEYRTCASGQKLPPEP